MLLLFAPARADAQPVHWTIDEPHWQLPTAQERTIADAVSWATVSAAIALDTWQTCLHGPDRHEGCWNEGLRLGLTWFGAYVTKVTVHRLRPCAPDCGRDQANESFYSMHTAFAFQAVGGPRLALSVPLAVSTGGLRVAAGKHWVTDVLTGAGVGLLTSRIR